jgi:molecular chaperone GrpE
MATPKKNASNDSQLEELSSQLEELTSALQRERADAINVRRRADEEKLKMSGYFKASVVKELLPFIDNFDKALVHAPKSEDKAYEDWLKGLSSVNKQLWQSLDSLGVKRIETVGKDFDPKFHEAVQMDNDSQGTKEVITEEFMSGYTLEDEVIRHAMVKVAMQ